MQHVAFGHIFQKLPFLAVFPTTWLRRGIVSDELPCVSESKPRRIRPILSRFLGGFGIGLFGRLKGADNGGSQVSPTFGETFSVSIKRLGCCSSSLLLLDVEGGAGDFYILGAEGGVPVEEVLIIFDRMSIMQGCVCW